MKLLARRASHSGSVVVGGQLQCRGHLLAFSASNVQKMRHNGGYAVAFCALEVWNRPSRRMFGVDWADSSSLFIPVPVSVSGCCDLLICQPVRQH